MRVLLLPHWTVIMEHGEIIYQSEQKPNESTVNSTRSVIFM